MEDTKIPLSKWFIAMYLCFSHKKGVSSHQLARDLGITQKSAWFILHRIRSFVSEKAPEMLLQNIVESDTAFIGGKDKNRHTNKKTGKNHAPVVGAVQRGGKVVTKYEPNHDAEHINEFLKNNVKEGAMLYTDEGHEYAKLDSAYYHDTVKHMIKEYVRGDVSTNAIENYWSVLKRVIYGTYHQVSRKHLQKYLDETSFRYSTRKHTEQERFDKALSLCAGRLRYEQLIQNPQK